MSDVADLSLCSELYKISGWAGTHQVWYFSEDYDCVDDSEDIVTCRQTMGDRKTICPAYSLGYLLRKLPDCKVLNVSTGTKTPIYGAIHNDSDTVVQDETPENATCSLAIQLIKSGIIPINKEG